VAEEQPVWNENAVAQAARFAPANAGFVQAWASPSPDQAWALVRSRILDPGPAGVASHTRAPRVNLSEGVSGSESDLEIRIDQPPVDLSDQPEYQPLQRLLRAVPVEAMLQIRTTRQIPGGVFTGIDSGVVLLGGADWDIDAVHGAFSTALASQLSIQSLGALPGLSSIRLAFNGRALLMATSQELLQAMLASPTATLPAARYAAIYRHSQELKDLTRIVTLIDAPNAAAAGGTEPPFFSRNLASLGETLSWVESQAVTVHDTGASVQQTVLYRVRK
jgi:hypothetical protein